MPEELTPREIESRDSFTRSFAGSKDTIRSFTGGPSDPPPLPADLPFSVAPQPEPPPALATGSHQAAATSPTETATPSTSAAE